MEQAERLNNANGTTQKYMLASMGAGLIPIPIVDFVALTGIQLKLLHNLGQQYDVPFSKDMGKSIISSLLGGLIPVNAGKWAAGSLAKLIPIGGTAAGMVTTSVFGGASTYAIGKMFIQHFESGGTFLTFDPNKVREHFAAEFEKGKEEVKASQEQQATP
ncbi:MAG: GTPase [Candidatus Parabeggiatoa sp. nov. 1]|nr:MAG: GTPase [Gammaproteobacteria bacterium]